MKILFAASEAVPFIKSGGLADVAGSLSKSLQSGEHTCRVVLPLYQDIPVQWRGKMRYLTHFDVPLGWRNQYCGVFEAEVDGVVYYLLDNEYYFKRGGAYGFFDDAERFAFFARAILEMLLHIDYDPQIIHCNDWQTALVPVYLNAFYRGSAKLNGVKTVFTIHNIQYQGTYDLAVAGDVLGLPAGMVEYAGDVNFMKGAIEQAEMITTVSPTYAGEILDPWFAHGLDAILREKQYKLRGILNGIDTELYNPQTDPHIGKKYSAGDLAGKREGKTRLLRSLSLNENEESMVIGMIGRLVGHKGLDLVREVFDDIMELDVKLVLLGSGDWQYEKFFREAVSHYPRRVSVTLGFNEPLARRIYSGADCLLMPSKSEPCGLAQMIALRYGTIPIVRATGGLRDTVHDFGGEDGNGYDFQTYNAYDMLDAIRRCYADFQDQTLWQSHIQAAMRCDFSWDESAKQYIQLYQSL